MTDALRPFLEMIFADPDDDRPRLVYADFLEESGDPLSIARAEFIRVQVARARLPAPDPRRDELWRRDTELLSRYAARWRGELPVLPGVTWGGFLRGFVEVVNIRPQSVSWTVRPGNIPDEELARLLGEVFDATPIRTLRITWANLAGGKWLAVPGLERLRVLELDASELGDVGAQAMATCPRLAGLERLTVRGCGVTGAGARALAESPHLARLARLDLADNPILAEDQEALRARFGTAVRFSVWESGPNWAGW